MSAHEAVSKFVSEAILAPTRHTATQVNVAYILRRSTELSSRHGIMSIINTAVMVAIDNNTVLSAEQKSVI